MLEPAIKAIKASSKHSSVYIGCDSVRFKKNKMWYARYATVIVLHHDSCRGAAIYHHEETMPDYGNIKLRLMNEVMFAANTAMELVDYLDGRHLEIHLDLNPNPQHKSNVAVKEALGYIQGTMGFAPKIKPDAWAASHASDHCARGKQLTH